MTRVQGSSLMQQQSRLPRQERRLSPFSIPEMLFMLGSYLDLVSLITCLRVSRHWYSILLPCLWVDLTLYDSDYYKQPSFAVARSHSSLIQRLTIQGQVNVSFRQFLICDNLTRLFIRCRQKDKRSYDDLIQRHQRTLTDLTSSQPTTAEHLATLYGCERLRELVLLGVHLSGPDQWRIVYEKLWSRLQVLVLHGSWLRPSNENNTTLQPREVATCLQSWGPLETRCLIQNLTLVGGDLEAVMLGQLWLIEQCSELVRLWWTPVTAFEYEQGPMHRLVEAMRSGHHWRLLVSLHLPQRFLQSDFEVLLENMNQLTELDLHSSNFDLCSFETLRACPHHLATLRVLNLDNCTDLPGVAIHSILCSTPQLEIFKGYLLTDKDMEDGQPWICTNLRTLTLTFALQSYSTLPMVIARLSRQIRLEDCQLREGGPMAGPCQGVLFTLSEGIEESEAYILSKQFQSRIVPSPTALDRWKNGTRRVWKSGQKRVWKKPDIF